MKKNFFSFLIMTILLSTKLLKSSSKENSPTQTKKPGTNLLSYEQKEANSKDSNSQIILEKYKPLASNILSQKSPTNFKNNPVTRTLSN